MRGAPKRGDIPLTLVDIAKRYGLEPGTPKRLFHASKSGQRTWPKPAGRMGNQYVWWGSEFDAHRRRHGLSGPVFKAEEEEDIEENEEAGVVDGQQ